MIVWKINSLLIWRWRFWQMDEVKEMNFLLTINNSWFILLGIVEIASFSKVYGHSDSRFIGCCVGDSCGMWSQSERVFGKYFPIWRLGLFSLHFHCINIGVNGSSWSNSKIPRVGWRRLVCYRQWKKNPCSPEEMYAYFYYYYLFLK